MPTLAPSACSDAELAALASSDPLTVLGAVQDRLLGPPVLKPSADWTCAMIASLLPPAPLPKAMNALMRSDIARGDVLRGAKPELLSQVVEHRGYKHEVRAYCLVALRSLGERNGDAQRELLRLGLTLKPGEPFAEASIQALRAAPEGTFGDLVSDRWCRAHSKWWQALKWLQFGNERLGLVRAVATFGELPPLDQEKLAGIALTVGHLVERMALVNVLNRVGLSAELKASITADAPSHAAEPEYSALVACLLRGSAVPGLTAWLTGIVADRRQLPAVRAAAVLALSDLPDLHIVGQPSWNEGAVADESTSRALLIARKRAATDRRDYGTRADLLLDCQARIIAELKKH